MELGGPEELTADEVFAIAGEGGSRRISTPREAAERLTTLLEIPVSGRATEFFAVPSIADAPDAADEFGVSTTPFEDGPPRDRREGRGRRQSKKAADRVRRDA